MTKIFIALAVASCMINTAAASEDTNTLWQPHIRSELLGGTEFISDETVLFAPLLQSDNKMLFLDLRGVATSIEDQHFQTLSAGLATRAQFSNLILGAYGFLDWRHVDGNSSFFQGSIGLEAMGSAFEARLNTYLPFDDLFDHMEASELIFENEVPLLAHGEQHAAKGIDGEVGFRIDLAPLGAETGLDLWAFGGGYTTNDALGLNDRGATARAELRWTGIPGLPAMSRLTAIADLRTSRIEEPELRIGARLRIPIGSGDSDRAMLSELDARMIDPIHRRPNLPIYAAASGARENIIDVATEVLLLRSAHADDLASVNNAIALGPNTFILVQDGGSAINGNITLTTDQTILGGGATIRLRGAASGYEFDFTGPGARPHFYDTGNAPVAQVVGANVHIAGLELDGAATSQAGIEVLSGNRNIVVEQNDIHDISGYGIVHWGMADRVRVLANRLDQISNAGLHQGWFSRDIIVDGNVMTNIGPFGITNGLFSSDFTITNNEIYGGFAGTIQLSSVNDAIVADNVLVGGGSVLYMNGPNTNVVIGDNIFLGDASTQNLIYTNFATNMSISNNVFENSAGWAMIVNGLSVDISRNRFLGSYGNDLIWLSANTVLQGSDNENLTTSINGLLCNVSGTPVGSFTFTNNTSCP